ncbi:MAG TPA: lipid-A-disaccharide synthase [Chitinophagaceae bacterium]|nr:lipid-A-disaccharide synthase [Chitinophagaceae bacterium]
MRYYIIAGEASGDLHGSNLIRALRRLDPGAVIQGWGGELMAGAGAEIVKNYRDLAFMGLTDVLLHIHTILANFRFCKGDIQTFKPDVLILIDYPGFNLRMANWAHKQGLKVVFYISPQVWAWKENRVDSIKASVDKMLVILPFEQEFYKKWAFDVEFVGHPLVEVVRSKLESSGPVIPGDKPLIALLPGSRKQEVLRKLPVMLTMVKHFPDYEFIIALAPGLEDQFIENIIRNFGMVRYFKGRTYDILKQASAALVTSGTATLETALFGVPEVVCYKTSWINYWAARRLIRIKYISLVNLIMDKPVICELIQGDLNETRLKMELKAILGDEERKKEMKRDFAALWTKLGDGHASHLAAETIFLYLKNGESRNEKA